MTTHQSMRISTQTDRKEVRMANLRGIIESDKSSCSRLSTHIIGSSLSTWGGKIETTLNKDGKYYVTVNNKLIATGYVEE